MSSSPKACSPGGFTLIELVIVLVIVGVLAAISVPLYTSYVKRSISAEGKALCGSVATAERMYHSDQNKFATVSAGSTGDANISVDARSNKFFTRWGVAANAGVGDAATFTVTTTGTGDGAGITVNYTGTPTGPPTVADGL